MRCQRQQLSTGGGVLAARPAAGGDQALRAAGWWKVTRKMPAATLVQGVARELHLQHISQSDTPPALASTLAANLARILARDYSLVAAAFMPSSAGLRGVLRPQPSLGAPPGVCLARRGSGRALNCSYAASNSNTAQRAL